MFKYSFIPGDVIGDGYTKQVLLLASHFLVIKSGLIKSEIQISRKLNPRGLKNWKTESLDSSIKRWSPTLGRHGQFLRIPVFYMNM